MIPDWVNDVVRDFGRQMRLESFALNDRGTAGVRFENGISLRLEYVGESLMMMVGLPIQSASGTGAYLKLLEQSHYDGAGSIGIRAAVLPRSGEAILTLRITERTLDLPQMETAFERLWQAAMEIGGRA